MLINSLKTQSESELLYDWRFTANQFVLAPCPVRLTKRVSFATERLRSQSLCNILSDENMGLPLTNWLCFAFVKCTYRTHCMLLNILPCALFTIASALSIQALQSRSCLSHVTATKPHRLVLFGESLSLS
jgi:hypothetical protein